MTNQPIQRVTRLAPSPTGTLHLGNIRTFLVNWALARNLGWRIVMRIEDLDVERVRPGSAENMLAALRWLGVDFDEGPFFQSHDLEPYRAAMRQLAEMKRTFACALTRKQIRAASSAPHAGESEMRFPSSLRPTDSGQFKFGRDDTNYRLLVADEAVEIHDEFAGDSVHHPHREVGDFVIWTRLGVPAYQLAVVVDDARQGVTDVVRGDDLLPSAARQLLLYRALQLRPPRWWHLPLVLSADGRRLAKRDQHTHLDSYHGRDVRPERIIGLVAFWCGVIGRLDEMSAADFRAGLRLDTLSRSPVTFTKEQHEWLLV